MPNVTAPDLTLRHDYEIGLSRLYWQDPVSVQIVDELVVPATTRGCQIEEFALSPSGTWIVTSRCSGQGEWGYDVIRAHPLERQAGIDERDGYMLDLPGFSSDESYLLGGYGENWLGGWWADSDVDIYESPARGGSVHFGWLYKHCLPDHDVRFHELRMTLPAGWYPADPENETWCGARSIEPFGQGVRLTLPGGIPIQMDGPLPPVIELPAPRPDGGGFFE